MDEDLKLVRGKYSSADLIQNLQSAEELLDQVKWEILDVDEALQEGRLAAIAPDQEQKRAAGARRWRTLVPPELYHVWSHAEMPEDRGGPGRVDLSSRPARTVAAVKMADRIARFLVERLCQRLHA